MLTQDQEKAKQELLGFLVSDTSKFFVLSGYAGVGKTFLIQHVQEAYNTCIAKMNQVTGGTKPKQWVYTATTNKAVHSLKQAVHDTEVRTIHSLLGLRVRNDYKKGQSFVSQAYGVDNVENSIVVIDEASYVDYQLLHYINKTISDSSKVIFMGDPTQLTPVGLNHCPVFKNTCEDKYALTEVVRQSKQHPLTPLLDSFRQYILGLTQQFPKVTTCNFIQVVDTPTFEQMLLKEFNSEWHSSMSKVLAWRNKTVIKYNDFIFNALNNRTSFAIGDIVTNNHAVGQYLKTDAEVEIVGGCSTQSLGYKGTNYLVETSSGISVPVFVPDKQSDYTRAKNKAVKEGQTKDVQVIMDTWADLRPAFASTVNKAQGSTYDKVFIDLSDFKPMVHKDPIQLARLLYVAMSRAKYQVIFTGDLC